MIGSRNVLEKKRGKFCFKCKFNFSGRCDIDFASGHSLTALLSVVDLPLQLRFLRRNDDDEIDYCKTAAAEAKTGFSDQHSDM